MRLSDVKFVLMGVKYYIFNQIVSIKTYFSFSGLTPYEKGSYKFNTIIIHRSRVQPAWQAGNH